MIMLIEPATISLLCARLLRLFGRRPELLDPGYPRWRISGDPWRTVPTGGGQSGSSSSPLSGLSGPIETRSCSGVEPPPLMQFCTMGGVSFSHGTELA